MTLLAADINVLLKFPTIAVTFYLLFSVAGLIFCVINSVINLLLFNNQSKVRRRDTGGHSGVNILQSVKTFPFFAPKQKMCEFRRKGKFFLHAGTLNPCQNSSVKMQKKSGQSDLSFLRKCQKGDKKGPFWVFSTYF